MIYAKRKDLGRYLGMSGSLDTAIRYLQNGDLKQLHKGRNEIDGDQAFVNRFDYQTMPQEQAIWEGHIRYPCAAVRQRKDRRYQCERTEGNRA